MLLCPKAGSAAESQNEKATASAGSLSHKITESEKKKLSEELGVGEITLTDILSELEKPSRDPRESMPAPILRSDVLDMNDLKPGMVLKGTVRNVIDFGCFVDIGVHQDGLVHISHITDRFIKHPLEAVSVGDIVDVQVLDVEVDKKRISLSMKLRDPAQVAAEAAEKAAKRPAPKPVEQKESKPAEKKASAKKSVVKKTTVKKTEVAKSETATKKLATSAASTGASAAKSASGATSATGATSTTEAAPVKKLKKKGIVIFKGNAND